MDFENAKELHNQAMEFAQLAYCNQTIDGGNNTLELYSKAYELEKQAALLYQNNIDFEPTRSVLFRSAASLAKMCGKFNEAIELAKLGLNGNPSSPTLEELQSILDSLQNNYL